MRRSVITVVLGVLMVLGSLAIAAPGPTDDNNNNLYGLCTAYFNGSQNGQEHKRKAPPFQGLESYVANNDGVDNDGDDQTDEGDEDATPAEVWSYCQNNGGVGGQPDNPNTPENDGNGKNARGRG